MTRPFERLRIWRLKFWLRVMAALETRGLDETEFYYWATRRAAGCNSWRRWQ